MPKTTPTALMSSQPVTSLAPIASSGDRVEKQPGHHQTKHRDFEKR